MIEIINHTGNITFPGNYKPDQSISLKRNDVNEKRNISQTLSKYILEDKMIVFERYDGSGKLISRVPLNGHMLRVKA
jgi:hypothetical protein